MKQVSRRAGAFAAALLGVLALQGCAEEESGFFVIGNVVIDAPDCVASPDSSATLHSSGVLDVGLRLEYEASLLVGSQLTPRGDKTNLRTETMITTITGAEVRLFTDTGQLDTEFTVPASGVILPDAGNEAGLGIVTATLIPASTAVAIAAELNNPAEARTRLAKIVVFGETLGGLEVESAEHPYVISVCEGCLVDFPVGLDPTLGCLPGGAGADSIVPPCRPGQDDAVDCRYCASQNAFCQFPGGVP